MKINLTTESGINKLQAALDEVQHLSRTRTVTAAQIAEAVDTISLELDIPKKAQEGTTAEIDLNAQNFPSAYKGRPESTIVSVAYSNGKWWATDVRRGDTHRQGHKADLRLSDTAKAALIARFSTLRI